jgi:hypothetical protein
MLFESPYDEAIQELRKNAPLNQNPTPWEREGLTHEKWKMKFYEDFRLFSEELDIRLNIERAQIQKSLYEF